MGREDLVWLAVLGESEGGGLVVVVVDGGDFCDLLVGVLECCADGHDCGRDEEFGCRSEYGGNVVIEVLWCACKVICGRWDVFACSRPFSIAHGLNLYIENVTKSWQGFISPQDESTLDSSLVLNDSQWCLLNSYILYCFEWTVLIVLKSVSHFTCRSQAPCTFLPKVPDSNTTVLPRLSSEICPVSCNPSLASGHFEMFPARTLD